MVPNSLSPDSAGIIILTATKRSDGVEQTLQMLSDNCDDRGDGVEETLQMPSDNCDDQVMVMVWNRPYNY